MESHYVNVVCNVQTHVCAYFGHDTMNLVMDMAMNLAIWLGIHESSYMIVHFVKTIFLTSGMAKFFLLETSN